MVVNWSKNRVQTARMSRLVHGPLTRYVKLRMHRECREHFPRHRLQRKPLVSDPGMQNGTCVTRVQWYMSGSLIGRNAPGIPGAWVTRNFMYLTRGPCEHQKILRENIFQHVHPSVVLEHHTVGKWLIQGCIHRKDTRLHTMKYTCR